MHKNFFFFKNYVRRSISTSCVRYLEFNEQHQSLQNTVNKIIEKDINPYIDEWEIKEQFEAHSVFKKLGDAGLLGLTRSKNYYGQELDYSYTVALYEEIGRRVNCGGIATSLSVQTDMALPALSNFGSHEVKQNFLSPSIKGDYVACVGVTEPSGGSDVAAIKTFAKQKGDDFVINGEKMWITNGCQADWMCLLANTSDGKPHKNKSLICVPLNSKGVTRSKIKKLGNHCLDTALINFDNVHVPIKNIMGELNEGFTYQMIQFQEECLVLGAILVSSFQHVLDETINYCRERNTFGNPLIHNQYVHFRLAELQTEIELFRALYYETAKRFMNGEDVTYHASMIKLKAGRLARELSDTCLQYFGGMGYAEEMLISRTYRDFRLLSIAGGADEIMLGIICKFMGTLPNKRKN